MSQEELIARACEGGVWERKEGKVRKPAGVR